MNEDIMPFLRRWPVMIGERFFMHTLDGHRLLLDPNDLQLCCHMTERGVWEEHVREILALCLQPGGTYVDVGANVGLHTLYASAIVQQTGKCYAFEASPRAYDFLKVNIDVNGLVGWVFPYNAIVSDTKKKMQFYHHNTHPMQSAITIPEATIQQTSANSEDLTIFEIESVTLDDELGDIVVDVLKIDVEGYEPQVVAGARKIIQRNPDITLIIERNGMSKSIDPAADNTMVTALRDEGFVPHIALWLQPLRNCNWDDLPHGDLVLRRTPFSFAVPN
jgi:FkbM family methyltransferase